MKLCNSLHLIISDEYKPNSEESGHH